MAAVASRDIPELMAALRSHKAGVLKKKAATKLYSTGLSNTAYTDLKELNKYHGLDKDSPFWATKEGAKLIAKLGEIPEKNDYFWSTAEGAMAMNEFAEMMKKLMYPHGKEHVWCPGKGGNVGGEFMMERAIEMLVAQGHSGERDRRQDRWGVFWLVRPYPWV